MAEIYARILAVLREITMLPKCVRISPFFGMCVILTAIVGTLWIRAYTGLAGRIGDRDQSSQLPYNKVKIQPN